MNLNLVTTPSSGDFNLRLSPLEEKPTSRPGTECLLNKGGQVIQPDPPKVFQLHQLCERGGRNPFCFNIIIFCWLLKNKKKIKRKCNKEGKPQEEN